MNHPFEALRPEYTTLLRLMRVTRGAAVDSTAHRLLGFIDAGRYDAGCKATGVPVIIAAASFEREASSNFSLNPAQGAPLHQRSTIIPHNGPFDTWTEAQIAAYQIDGLDKVGAANWSWELGCYYEERFNGFGPRNHGRHSGYLWSGSNIYTGGKYVSDGVWSASAIDQQLGVIPIMKRIVELRPSLELPIPFPMATGAPTSPPVPAPVPEGHHNAAALQAALNALGADPQLVVDDNYGRSTRHAVIAFQSANGLEPDGIAGPTTWAAIGRGGREAPTISAPLASSMTAETQTMRFTKFTNPNGEAIYINPEQVMMVRPAMADADSPQANAVVVLVSGSCAVHENVGDVMKLLGATQ